MLPTRENSDVFNTIDEIYNWYSPQKSQYPLYTKLLQISTEQSPQRNGVQLFKVCLENENVSSISAFTEYPTDLKGPLVSK